MYLPSAMTSDRTGAERNFSDAYYSPLHIIPLFLLSQTAWSWIAASWQNNDDDDGDEEECPLPSLAGMWIGYSSDHLECTSVLTIINY